MPEGFTATRATWPPVNVAPAPATSAVTPEVKALEVIQPSDPRHPQHQQWLEMQAPPAPVESVWTNPWVLIGGGGLIILGALFFFGRKHE